MTFLNKNLWAFLHPWAQTGRNQMFRSAIPTAHFAFVLCVSTLSVGCLSAERPQARSPFQLQPSDFPSFPAHTTRSPVESPSPFDGQTELNRTALRQAVLKRNPTFAAMQHAWRAAKERYPQVSSLDDPMFSYGLAPATIGASTVDVGQRFEISQRFPWPGTLRLRGAVARSEAQAAGEDLSATRLQLLAATDHVFYDLYFVQRAIDINQVNQKLLLEFQRITERRYAAGLVPKQEALHAEVEYQHLVHRGIVLAHTRTVTVARLNTLLNLPPGTAVPSPPKDLPGVTPLPPIEALHASAVQHRPELRALALTIEARSTDVKLAELDYFPNLTVSGGYNSLWQQDDLRPIVGVSLNFPFQFDQRKAALAEARAKQQQVEARLEEQRAHVAFTVSQATETVQENAHIIELYTASLVPAAEENLAAAHSDYEAGLTDFVTLCSAEKALMLAELNYHQALANYHTGRAQLERALGIPLENVEVRP